jgi:hypothetical protein
VSLCVIVSMYIVIIWMCIYLCHHVPSVTNRVRGKIDVYFAGLEVGANRANALIYLKGANAIGALQADKGVDPIEAFIGSPNTAPSMCSGPLAPCCYTRALQSLAPYASMA